MYITLIYQPLSYLLRSLVLILYGIKIVELSEQIECYVIYLRGIKVALQLYLEKYHMVTLEGLFPCTKNMGLALSWQRHLRLLIGYFRLY